MVFDEVFGHEKQKRQILGFFEKGRVPHAFMFTGPEGIGKKTLALKLASYLLCRNGQGGDNCISCVKLERGFHPDFFMVGEKRESIGIETVKSLSLEAKKRPHEAKMRFFIFDNCHLMTNEAANSILKTLEEPLQSSLFVLITHREWEILQTIRSRCVLIRFSSLDEETLTSYLLRKQRIPIEKASVLSRISLGSIGLCEFWMRDDNFSLRREIADTILRGKVDFLTITRIAEEIEKRGVMEYIGFIMSLLRDLILFHMTKETKKLYNRDLVGSIEEAKIEPKRASEILSRLRRAQRDLGYNINQWAYLEGFLLAFRDLP